MFQTHKIELYHKLVDDHGSRQGNIPYSFTKENYAVDKNIYEWMLIVKS